MAEDRKLSALAAADALDLTALTYVVQAPTSDPSSRKASLSELSAAFVAGGVFQAASPLLASIAAQGMATDRLIYGTGVDTVALSTLTAAGRALLDDADAATQRTTLGLGSAALESAAAFATAAAATSLSTALGAETGARAASDTSLSTAVSTEVSTRAAGDVSLSTALSGETSTRTAGVTSLSTAVAGKQAADADLDALAANAANGLWARTGAGTGAARTVTGTASQISVANGDGAAGNPTLSIPSNPVLPGNVQAGTSTTANLSVGSAAPSTNAVNFGFVGYATIQGAQIVNNCAFGHNYYYNTGYKRRATGVPNALFMSVNAPGDFDFCNAASDAADTTFSWTSRFYVSPTGATTAQGLSTASGFTPTATVANGLGLAGVNNPALYAGSTKVLDVASTGVTAATRLKAASVETDQGLVSGVAAGATANIINVGINFGSWEVTAFLDGHAGSIAHGLFGFDNGGLCLIRQDNAGGAVVATFSVSGSNIRVTNNGASAQTIKYTYRYMRYL